ncbi:Beta-helix repeat-dontaining protein [Desulfonema limicola]|uniref:Beta-helix repeat-dontaining protein n=1 Tax=Desulfonema limicola TaxID=45656 RepID=A0A975B7F6_9BACT|nr:right-handed parallel beta-helix repeat-containing protein [Desulfonema limicola]QTA80169.1 Beta-helix repeat-dontaining protein [Desulfonema limicola]
MFYQNKDFKITVSCFWIFLICLLFPGWVMAQIYYISTSGNDSNDGLSQSFPWKTIDKINSLKASETTGSSILFKRGDVLRGQIDLQGDPVGVIFDAYGTGENPVISGSLEITGWSVYKENIYSADVSALVGAEGSIHHLFVNKKLMTIARYPNIDAPDQGWLKVDASPDKSTLTDQALAEYGKADNYWTDAVLKIRTFSWYFETRKIKDYKSNGTIILDQDLSANLQPGWGYYLDNKLEELDQANEWYYDPLNKKVYLWAPDSADPNTLVVEGSVFENGIRVYWKNHETVIQNLKFQHQVKNGIYINQCDRVKVLNNRFEYCGERGIQMAWNSVDIEFKGNFFENMLDYAITWNANIPAGNSVIESNIIKNTALIPGYGGSGVTHSIAIRIGGTSGIVIQRNIIENTGYAGIILEGDAHIVENNIVKASLLTLDDGGGILVNCSNNKIRNNFITESWGNRDASSGTNNNSLFRQMGMGIFFQPKLSGNIIEGNIVANNVDFGIYPNRAINTIIRNNVCYNNKYQIYLKGADGDTADNAYNNTIEGNILCSLSPKQICLRSDENYKFGTFNNQYYINPYSDIVIIEGDNYYSLPQWQNKFKDRDVNAQVLEKSLDLYTITSKEPNLITNSDFNSDISSWSGSGAASISYDPGKSEMDGGSLKNIHSVPGTSTIKSGYITLEKDHFYRFSFIAAASSFGDVKVRFFREDIEGPWIEYLESWYGLHPVPRKHNLVFQWPFETTLKSRPFFLTYDDDPSEYWLDNVMIEPVEVVIKDPTQDIVLFINTDTQAKQISLKGNTYTDLDNQTVTGSITLENFKSRLLVINQRVSLADCIKILQILAQEPGAVPFATGDFDGDGIYELEDCAGILRSLANI